MRILAVLPLLTLAACGPRITAEVVAGRTVLVTNGEARDIVIRRIVANRDEGTAGCVDAPEQTVGPGRSYTVTLFDCDAVTALAVETDAGTARPSVPSD